MQKLYSLGHLFSYAWFYLVSSLGTTTLAIVYSALLIVGGFSAQVLFKWYRGKQGTTLRQALKERLGQSVLVTIAFYLIAGFLLFFWHTATFIYKDHKALLSRVYDLKQELKDTQDKYEKDISNGDKAIRDRQFKQNSITPPTAPTPPMPTPNIASIRIASQKQIVSTNAQLPYGLEVILQTDTDIEPVNFEIEFDGEINSGDVSPIGISSDGVTMISINGKHWQISHKLFRFGWQLPKFTADNPIRVTVFSKTYVKALRLQKL